MKVGIDCRPLTRPYGGIGRYTLEIVRRLVRREGFVWYLYFSTRPSDEVLSCLSVSNVKICCAHTNGPLKEFYWYHVALPKLLRKDEVAFFWSPRHHLPATLERNVVAFLTVHDFTWRFFPGTMRLFNYWAERLQMPSSIERADKIFCVSHSTCNELGAFYPAKKSFVAVVPCGTTVMTSEISAAMDLPRCFLLFVGTPEPRKNLARILEAYAGLPNSIQLAYPLLVVGGRGWGVSLSKLVARYGLQDKVIILGTMSERQLSYVYSRATLLLMPSLYEGFGLPLLEAFQFGVPAVASATGALAEVAGDAAELVDPLSSDDIRRGIMKLLESPIFYSYCSAQALERVRKYSWDNSANSIAEYILEEAKKSQS
ncbi:glycosyltransferase family 4 protein [Stutzerimonas kunmingensis]|uniref:glycosyltransferase family 4 protein n=1 Tax=Stutzerimonas kunmingensis TaxID=1211807 RepID=UPI00241E1B38|nr:glycosyltransferase family 1 protein [Stutzerimonas kunmingensis]